jgi:glycosyltransferase involved in cell wall biosynthesis
VAERRLLWASLADQRPGRELYWLTRMPATRVTALGRPRPFGAETWQPMTYRRPIRRFVEAGALAWMRGLDDLPPDHDWVASLELCSLVTGQVSAWSRRTGVRQAVLTWENDARQPLYRIPPYSRALRSALREADLFLCFIEAARTHLVELGVTDERIRVVLPGVDTARFHPAAEPVDEPVLVYASPLAENKGLDRVLDAFDRVRRRVPDARLLVQGSGPLAGLVEAAEARTGGAVRLLPATAPDGVAETLRSGALFVTAPRATWKWNEQFGLAYLEAMATGLPVVTTVCGTNHEAVRPPNVRVPDDVDALADALVAFLEDPARRHEVGRANRRFVLEQHELGAQCRAMGEAFASREP